MTGMMNTLSYFFFLNFHFPPPLVSFFSKTGKVEASRGDGLRPFLPFFFSYNTPLFVLPWFRSLLLNHLRTLFQKTPTQIYSLFMPKKRKRSFSLFDVLPEKRRVCDERECRRTVICCSHIFPPSLPPSLFFLLPPLQPLFSLGILILVHSSKKIWCSHTLRLGFFCIIGITSLLPLSVKSPFGTFPFSFMPGGDLHCTGEREAILFSFFWVETLLTPQRFPWSRSDLRDLGFHLVSSPLKSLLSQWG